MISRRSSGLAAGLPQSLRVARDRFRHANFNALADTTAQSPTAAAGHPASAPGPLLKLTDAKVAASETAGRALSWRERAVAQELDLIGNRADG